ncbi:unnamed protein product [Gongylonema pulchrum]|uniref:glutaminase n=1 Tax=Gongylonema pulchrum TaxID=637853 RepID=A0A183CV16_9BILA|nr:unnamed protein product [Gongylonema pulchrum]
MVNAGAIVVASLMKRGSPLADRFDSALQKLKSFAAGGHVGFDNAVYLSERETGDRNYALAYYMREHGCFPSNISLQENLDLYFQLCAIETNVDTLAGMAATLANGGVSPLSEERVVCNRAVRDTLSLMYSCGMYDYSGKFAFQVGLPAKSGVSGCMIMVVPNVMSICLYSPPLDALGNTVRGVACLLLGANIAGRDYDDRTVLHVAAANGNENVLKFLLKRWQESPDPVDRFGRKPIDDAITFGHESCAEILRTALQNYEQQHMNMKNSEAKQP